MNWERKLRPKNIAIIPKDREPASPADQRPCVLYNDHYLLEGFSNANSLNNNKYHYGSFLRHQLCSFGMGVYKSIVYFHSVSFGVKLTCM